MKKKILIGVVVLVVLILVGGVFVVRKRQKVAIKEKHVVVQQPVGQQAENNANQNDLDQVSVDISDWQTYTDANLDFSFKYPSDWQTVNLINDYQGIQVIKSAEVGSFDVSVYKNGYWGMSMEKLDQLKNDTNYSNIKVTSFLGNKAISATFTNPNLNLVENKLYVGKDQTVYEISYKVDKYENIAKEILSTFNPVSINNEFDSKLINLSFTIPENSNYVERDIFENSKIKHTGRDVYFQDLNKSDSSFGAISKDFSADDVVPHDFIIGNLDTEKSFYVSYFVNKYTRIIKKAPGIYLVVGFDDMECSAAVTPLLIVAPPQGSDLKYISFFLGNPKSFLRQGSQSDPCSVNDFSIRQTISSIVNGKDEKINENLNNALKIAKTFKVCQ